MRVVLICPTNMLYMPYVDNYVNVLKENRADYDIINWDRFSIEKEDNLTYRDKKTGHRRNYYDYYLYKRFIFRALADLDFDRIIVFGLQLSYFLHNYLVNNHKESYVIDIRDYNAVSRVFNVQKLISNSCFSVISSPAYKSWLPGSSKLIINHNTGVTGLGEMQSGGLKIVDRKIRVSCIGAIRDYAVNKSFIDALRNSDNIDLYYHGDGIINDSINKYISNNLIENVFITGRYEKKGEDSLYIYSDLINIFRYNDGINNRSALPNRLYNAPLYGKPVIALEGTYLAEQVKRYNLGLVLDSFERAEEKIMNYLNEFNLEEYEKGRESFFENIIGCNEQFKNRLVEFISCSNS